MLEIILTNVPISRGNSAQEKNVNEVVNRANVVRLQGAKPLEHTDIKLEFHWGNSPYKFRNNFAKALDVETKIDRINSRKIWDISTLAISSVVLGSSIICGLPWICSIILTAPVIFGLIRTIDVFSEQTKALKEREDLWNQDQALEKEKAKEKTNNSKNNEHDEVGSDTSEDDEIFGANEDMNEIANIPVPHNEYDNLARGSAWGGD